MILPASGAPVVGTARSATVSRSSGSIEVFYRSSAGNLVSIGVLGGHGIPDWGRVDHPDPLAHHDRVAGHPQHTSFSNRFGRD